MVKHVWIMANLLTVTPKILSLAVLGRHNDSRLQHTAMPSLGHKVIISKFVQENCSVLLEKPKQEAKCSQADEQLSYREKSALKNVCEIYVFTLTKLWLQLSLSLLGWFKTPV